MNNFWDNIFRYPRFFITSFAGLIVIILTPFINLYKTSRLKTPLILIFIILLILLYFVLVSMLSL
uniref:Uncharacterized protein ycf33 n=1 Tax=Proboscia sp. TaxID=1923967 RepID=A0A2U9NM42_9STRA|nr:hypothetical protein ycf33 [Proboscia sp.]